MKRFILFLPMKRVCFLALFIFVVAPFSAYGDVSQVSQWRPYLEWSVTNTTWSGNPFDLVARVTFTHLQSNTQISTSMFYNGNDTWMYRFTGALAGEWDYVSESADADLDSLSGSITVSSQSVDGFYQRLEGDKWGWTGTDRAVIPNYVMLKKDPASWDSDEEIDALITEFIDGHGFTGFHVPDIAAYWFDKSANGNRFSDNSSLNSSDTSPDPDTFAALEKLIEKTHLAGGAVHFWLWGDSSRTQNLTVSSMADTGGANGVVDNRLQRYIAARLGPIAGWSAGYGFDLFEWTDESMLTTWSNYLNEELGWDHFLGARGRKNSIEESQISENLDYTAYEQHAYLYDFNDLVTTHQDRSEKPSFTEDRFRICNQNRAKDLQQDGSDTRTLLWDLAMAGGIAAIWGNLWDDADAEVSSPYPNKEQLKTYSTFWHDNNYFQSKLAVNQDLSSDENTRILVNPEYTEWILYRRDASSINVNLTSGPGSLQPVAVDTKKAYEETVLSPVDSVEQTISLPYSSDWVVRLTEIETEIEISQPSDDLTKDTMGKVEARRLRRFEGL